VAERRAIPEAVKREVLAEAGCMCANPRCKNALAAQMHHMTWVCDGGENEVENLVALCAYCHDLHTRKHIPADAVARWKLLLQSLNQALDRESLDLLQFLRRSDGPGNWRFRVSGDGILRLARLINSGLVDPRFVHGSSGSPATAAVHGVYEPQLTERGQRLIEAWRKGDVASFSHALMGEEALDVE
jgi:HNH endonuclease